MFFAILLNFLVWHCVRALPIPQSAVETPPNCHDLYHNGTIWKIIWSCLFTIFACTWTALHMNVPGMNESSSAIIWRHTKVAMLALVAPELVTTWAYCQYDAANEIVTKMREPAPVEGAAARDEGAAESNQGGEWTRYHGFFAIMGGYVDIRSRPILPTEDGLRRVRISKKDIEDKSKSNFIARFLVLLQTTWFVLQTITRAVRHLPVTELELMTIAFVVLNVVTFYFWLDKPLDVQRPYPIIDLAGSAYPTFPERIPPNPFNYLPRKLANMGFGIQQPLDGLYRVSTFYSGPPSYARTVRAACGAAVLAGLVGGIHCIAWSFNFPSSVEKILWRSSSVGATVMPLLLGLFHLLHISPFMQDDEQSRLRTYVNAKAGSPKWWVSWMVYFVYDVISYLYLFSRFILLVLPFVLLRSAISEAYRTIPWVTFIPHI